MADALEQAVIAMVLQGDALVSQRSSQVTADLTSAERAGKAAEGAAKAADKGVGQLGEQIAGVTAKMHLAVTVAERLVSAAGGDNEIFKAAGQGLREGVGAYRLLAATGIDAVLPGASILGGAAAGLFTGVSAYQKSEADQERKEDERADKLAEKVAKASQKQHDGDVAGLLARQAAISLLESHGRGGSGSLIP